MSQSFKAHIFIQSAGAKVKGNPRESILCCQLCGIQRSHLGHQAWQQAHFPLLFKNLSLLSSIACVVWCGCSWPQVPCGWGEILNGTEPRVFLLCVSHLLEKAGPWAKPTPEVSIPGKHQVT